MEKLTHHINEETKKPIKDYDRVQAKKDKYEQYKNLQLQPLSTLRLKPIKHANEKGGYVKINKEGWVV